MFLPADCTGSFEYRMQQFVPRGIEPDERVGRDWLSKHSQCSFVMVRPISETQLITNLTMKELALV